VQVTGGGGDVAAEEGGADPTCAPSDLDGFGCMVSPRADWALHWVPTKSSATSVAMAVVASAGGLGWAAVGFSRDGEMPGSDAVVTWDGEVKAYELGSYTTAGVAAQPALPLSEAQLEQSDGQIVFKFVRPLAAGRVNLSPTRFNHLLLAFGAQAEYGPQKHDMAHDSFRVNFSAVPTPPAPSAAKGTAEAHPGCLTEAPATVTAHKSSVVLALVRRTAHPHLRAFALRLIARAGAPARVAGRALCAGRIRVRRQAETPNEPGRVALMGTLHRFLLCGGACFDARQPLAAITSVRSLGRLRGARPRWEMRPGPRRALVANYM
jgi:hypothetical protein